MDGEEWGVDGGFLGEEREYAEGVVTTGKAVVGDGMRVCSVCGKRFKANGPGKYCSEACKREAANAQKRAYRKSEYDINATLVQCPICGKEFRPGIKRTKYCSEKCRKAAGSDRERKERRTEESTREWRERGYDVSGIRDAISQTNEVARMQHKSYGEIKAELLIQKMREGKV